jgi:hypothetical protein
MVGLYDRLTPEFAEVGDIEGSIEAMDIEDIARLRKLFHELPFSGTVTFSREAESAFATYWCSKTQEFRAESSRVVSAIHRDAGYQAIGQGRLEVNEQDMLDAIKASEREGIIRKRFFTEDSPDKVGYYAGKLKQLMAKMWKVIERGKTPEEREMLARRVAMTQRDLSRMVNAYRDNEEHIFYRAFVGFKETHMEKWESLAGNGKKVVRYSPNPEDFVG